MSHFLRNKLEGPYAEVTTRLSGNKVTTAVDYWLLHQAGEWRVYDIIVDEISLVHSYREQFTTINRKLSYAELVAKAEAEVRGAQTVCTDCEPQPECFTLEIEGQYVRRTKEVELFLTPTISSLDPEGNHEDIR